MDTKTNLTKRQLAALERLFVAHIQSAEEKSEPVAIVQSKAKVFQELEHDGLAEFVTWDTQKTELTEVKQRQLLCVRSLIDARRFAPSGF